MIANLFYLLAIHSHVQIKLQQEIDLFFKQNNNTENSLPFLLESYDSLHYLDLVIKETMRLYPSVAMQTTRICTKPDKIGNHDIKVGVNFVFTKI